MSVVSFCFVCFVSVRNVEARNTLCTTKPKCLSSLASDVVAFVVTNDGSLAVATAVVCDHHL